MNTTCNFIRVLAARGTRLIDVFDKKSEQNKYRDIRDRYEIYNKCTENFDKMKMTYDDFRSRVIRYQKFINTPSNFNNNKQGERKIFLEAFAYPQFLKLSAQEKKKHTFVNCPGCEEMMKSLFTKSDFKKFDFHGENPKDGKKFIKDLIKDLEDQGFQENFQISVKDAIGSSLRMVPKISSKENKKNETTKLKDTVKEISSRYKENSLQNILQENISFSQWDRQRKSNSLETSVNTRKRSSVGNFDNYSFDKVQFLAEVRGLKEGDEVNWSQLARNFNVNINGVLPSNGGQVLKEFAQVNGIDIDVFNVDRKISGRNYEKQRRQKKK